MLKNGIADRIDPLAAFASKAQVAEAFKISPRTLERWTRLRAFPAPVRLGRRTYFHLGSIEEFLTAKNSTPVRNRRTG